MNLQNNHDLRLAEAKVGKRIRQEVEARIRISA
jgi:plasmid maintenance system antidote protein VapI